MVAEGRLKFLMKRIFLLLVFSLALICGYAQEHLSFKGIPIEGSMSSFCKKLEAKGFTKIGSDGNMTVLDGIFTGKSATVYLIATSDGKDVNSVAVTLPDSDSWKTLVEIYDYYKSLYIEKYGQPSVHKEYNPSGNLSNTLAMNQIDEGKVEYGSLWEAPGGLIVMTIERGSRSLRGLVMIKYEDSQNNEKERQKIIDDI